jgi:1,4-dihydroxy-2-naphthoate octaprenyltransferase
MNADALSIRPGSPRAWLAATRPATLAVGAAPVLVGTSVASTIARPHLGAAVAALAGALLIQIGTNLANDAWDSEKGADTADRLGPVRVTQAGLLSARQVRSAMSVCFALATAVGLYLTRLGGPAVVAIGLVSIASGIAYTAGPWPLGYVGLGDVFVFAFFGPVAVCGTVLVEIGRVPWLAIVASVPLGALATAVLVVNNVRDVSTDRFARKRTLVVRFGRRFGVVEYALLLAVAFAAPLLIFANGRSAALLPLLIAPAGFALLRTLARSHDGPVLNRCLANTARLMLAFSVLQALGFVLAHRGA